MAMHPGTLNYSNTSYQQRCAQAHKLLTHTNPNGRYTYTYRQVQQLANISMAAVCAIAAEIGRSRKN